MSLGDRLREPISQLLDALTRDGRERVGQLLLDIDADLAALPTVPPARRERYLARIEAQLAVSLERERIRAVRASRAQVASVVSTLIRAVVAAL